MQKALSILAFSLSILFSTNSVFSHDDKQNIMIHLSHHTNDLHASSTALRIGRVLLESGASVTLFLDLEAVRLVDKNQPLNLTWGSGDSIETLYHGFIDAGGSILVCPHCAKSAGLTHLRKGAEMANKESIIKVITDADKILDF